MRPAGRWLVLLSVAIGVFLSRSSLNAGSGGEAPVDAEANRLLGEIAQAYRALDAYADKGVVHFEGISAVTKEIHSFDSVESFRFNRSGRFDLRRNTIRFLCDGKRLVVCAPSQFVGRDRMLEESPTEWRFVSVELTEENLKGVLSEDPTVSFLFAKPIMDIDVETLRMILLRSHDARHEILRLVKGIRLEANREFNGARVRVLFLDRYEGPNLRLLVSAEN